MNALVLYRISNRLFSRGFVRLSKVFDKITFMAFGCFLPGSATIGQGTKVAYGGIAIVIHSKATIGRNCLIGQGVTLGAKEPYASSEDHPRPTVGDDVYIAAGAKLLGGITIGNASVIGANAVVTKSFPAHSIIAGIPARQIGTTEPGYKAVRP